jgi:hypothetical protein
MRDPREDPYPDNLDDLLPPTHPNGPRRMRDVPAPCDPREDPIVDELLPDGAGVAGHWPAEHGTVTPVDKRQKPHPPPDDMLVDPAKWAALTRAERRALARHHRKVTR